MHAYRSSRPALPHACVKTRNDTGAARTYSSAGVYRARGAEVCVCERARALCWLAARGIYYMRVCILSRELK